MSFRNFSHLWSNPSKLDVRACFKEGLDLFLKAPGLSVGFWLVAIIVALMGLTFASIIPLLGNIAATTIHIALAGGFFMAGHKLYRGEEISLSDCFSGFNAMGQFVLMSLIVYGFFLLVLIPLGIGTYLLVDSGGANNFDDYFIGFYVALLVFVCIASLLFSIMYLFALPNILHLNLKAWGGMELSRRVIFKSFGRVLLLVFLIYLLNIAGTLLFGFGLLLTVPISFYVVQVAWEKMVGKYAVPHLDQLIDELGNDDSGELFSES